MIWLHLTLTLTLLSNYALPSQNFNEICLQWHNTVRKNITECKYSDQPKPKNMPDLIWDDDIAKSSKQHADKCVFTHSHTPGLGENIAMGGPGYLVESLMNLWLGEKDDYVYSSNKCSGKQCLHYTQLVWASTTKLGCAVTDCPQGRFLVCNYQPPGNFQGQKPYEAVPDSPCGSVSLIRQTILSTILATLSTSILVL